MRHAWRPHLAVPDQVACLVSTMAFCSCSERLTLLLVHPPASTPQSTSQVEVERIQQQIDQLSQEPGQGRQLVQYLGGVSIKYVSVPRGCMQPQSVRDMSRGSSRWPMFVGAHTQNIGLLACRAGWLVTRPGCPAAAAPDCPSPSQQADQAR